jgi:hypothetical protein
VRRKFTVNSTAELRATHGEVGPVAGAHVQVYDRKFTNSGADGRYGLDNVPLGSYLLKSSRVIDGKSFIRIAAEPEPSGSNERALIRG